jgi:hypothetical protein
MSDTRKSWRALRLCARILRLRLKKLKLDVRVCKYRVQFVDVFKELVSDKELENYMRNNDVWSKCFPDFDSETQELVKWLNESKDDNI